MTGLGRGLVAAAFAVPVALSALAALAAVAGGALYGRTRATDEPHDYRTED